jgi:hypothetical protein
MRALTRISLLALSLPLAGCLGATVEGGSIDGTPFDPVSAVHTEVNDVVVIFISNHPDPCTRLQDSRARISDLDSLRFDLSDIDINGFSIDFDPVEPGEYPIREGLGDFEGPGANALYENTEEDCSVDKSLRASEGLIELIEYDPIGVAVGTFELEMDNDDVIGTFRAGFCDIDEDELERDEGDCDP